VRAMTSSLNNGFRHRHVAVADSLLHVVEAGDPDGLPFLFLHGWPESWQSWQQVMTMAARQARPVAIDLPGVGESSGAATDGSKRQLAAVVHELISTMGLQGVTLVGQDVGGMVAYAYLSAHQDLARVVIMDVVVPGVDPWEEVLRNPYLWHFAMHMIPALPERLVQGHQEEYFGYFYDVLSHDKQRISAEARAAYAKAYATDSALTAGFNWYRTLYQDAADNRQAAAGSPATTCGCQLFDSCHATCAYSWISPPSRSRRATLPAAGMTGGSADPSGGACPKARCGRWPL
jgi:pimeloyl-ACP methyl ester carboxylesterase